MWFYMIALFVIGVGVVGGFASGGIFTLIFIPLGALMLVVAVLVGMWGRSQQAKAAGGSHESNPEPAPLPHTPAQGTARPSTPEELADARRVQQ